MVEGATLGERIRWLVKKYGKDQVRIWASDDHDHLVSDQSFSKWMRGGGMTDDRLRRLAKNSGENYLDLRFGQEWREAAAQEMGPDFPVDPVSERDTIDVFESLPPRYRELWVSIGKFLVYRYAPLSPRNPFPQSFLPLRMGTKK